MVDPVLFLTAIGWVALVWVTFAIALAHWGPGVARRRVQCPDKKLGARLAVLHSEPSFGALQASDVLACSLLGHAPVTCDKRCLARL